MRTAVPDSSVAGERHVNWHTLPTDAFAGTAHVMATAWEGMDRLGQYTAQAPDNEVM